MDVERTLELVALRLQQMADAHTVLAEDQKRISGLIKIVDDLIRRNGSRS